MKKSITLNCLIFGDGQDRVFKVKLNTSVDVAELKAAIKETRARGITHVADANDLGLWKVSIPCTSTKEEVEEFTSTGKELSVNLEQLANIFPDVPEKDHIHIIVKVPPEVQSHTPPSVGLPPSLLRLNCCFFGDPPADVFPVSINVPATVGYLREVIKEKNPHRLTHVVGAGRLELWKVSIPGKSTKEEVEKLMSTGEQLSSGAEELASIFPDVPEKGHIHIVVKVPPEVQSLAPPSANLQPSLLKLICYILGTPFDSFFVVNISASSLVGDLKEAIKEKKAQKLGSALDADDLRLWRTSIPTKTLEEKVQALDLEEGWLSADLALAKLFPDGPEDNRVHVVVERPFAGEQSDTLSRLPLFEARKRVYKSGTTPDPSTDAVPSIFRQIQDDDKEFYLCCRPPDRQYSIPLVLLDPVFGEFIDSSKTATPGAQDYAAAKDVKRAMCDFYDNDKERCFKLRSILEEYGIETRTEGIGKSAIQPDAYVASNDRPVLILGVKNEMCSTPADPVIQSLLHYDTFCRQYAFWEDTTSCHPCFVVVLAGPYLSFGGCAMAERSIMEMFSSLPLAFHETNENAYDALARHLCTLKAAVGTLRVRYQNSSGRAPSPGVGRGPRKLFPYPNEFTLLRSQGKERLTYLENLHGGPTVFRGLTAHNRLVCVKFVQRYGIDVHRWCWAKGFAPELIGYEQLHDGWLMIIMELLGKSWVELDPREHNSEDLKGLVRSSIDALHENGMVHGDIRRANIMVKPRGTKFMLIDYDWAGLVGQVEYPSFMNKAQCLGRPSDVDDCKPILPEHDSFMVDGLYKVRGW